MDVCLFLNFFFFFYQQLFIVCSTSKGRDQVPCTLREGTYFSTSSTQHNWELITIKICLCVHTFGSCWLGTSRRSAGKQMTHSGTNIGTACAGQVVVD